RTRATRGAGASLRTNCTHAVDEEPRLRRRLPVLARRARGPGRSGGLARRAARPSVLPSDGPRPRGRAGAPPRRVAAVARRASPLRLSTPLDDLAVLPPPLARIAACDRGAS